MRFKVFKPNGILAAYVNTIKEAQEICDREKRWYYQKPKDINTEELNQHVIWLCVNKQLEPHGYTYSDVKKDAPYEYFYKGFITKKKFLFIFNSVKTSRKKVPWYQYLTFKTEEEFNEWKKFCIDTIKKELKVKKEQAESTFDWLNLNWDLKQDYEIS